MSQGTDDRPTSRAAAARRQRILETALRLFASGPYAGVHMDAIAFEAAVAKPTLYRYFETKEGLFIAALEWALDDMRSAIQAARSEHDSQEAKLRRLVALVLRRTEQLTPALVAIENQNAEWGTQSRRVIRRGFRNLRSEIAALVREGVEAREFADLDPDLAALLILGGIRMAAHAELGRADRLAAAMGDILVRGLRARDGVPECISSSPELEPTGAIA